MTVILPTSASQSPAQGLQTGRTETAWPVKPQMLTICDPFPEKQVNSCLDHPFHGKVTQSLQGTMPSVRGGGNSLRSSWAASAVQGRGPEEQRMARTTLPNSRLLRSERYDGRATWRPLSHSPTGTKCPEQANPQRREKGFVAARGWG